MLPSTQPRQIDTSNAPWCATADPGVERMPLATSPSGVESALVRLAPGTAFPELPDGFGLELLVLKGQVELPGGPLTAGGYARQPLVRSGEVASDSGCTLFVRSGQALGNDPEAVRVQTQEQPWLPGQGNLRVKPLHSHEGEGTALVHWPSGEHFVPHRHWGGEEIVVLSGTFEDEHGRYPQGTWLQSPHLSAHDPFVQEETVIWVKTGHLHPDS